MKLAAGYIERGEVNVDKLLTHSFELSEINEAFQTAVERPDGFVKATVKMPE
jgi:Zn-dependent alcohol dehydrogenase